jgi:amidase
MSNWEQIAADKRARIDKSIPAEWKIQSKPEGDSVMDFPAKSGILSPKELEITTAPATELVAKLASGELKSVDVTLAFCKRAALAHQVVRGNFLSTAINVPCSFLLIWYLFNIVELCAGIFP